jgi:hypothetical protein
MAGAANRAWRRDNTMIEVLLPRAGIETK